MKKLIQKTFIGIAFLLLFSSCTEPYALQNEDFEEILVVEATITNQIKKHEIIISKTYPLETADVTFEKNATVFLKDNIGTTYNFIETDNKYVAENDFAALPGRNYQLFIKTANGDSYISAIQNLPKENTIDNINTVVKTVNGKKGLEINVDHRDSNNESKFYRYTYEETFKIIAPKWIDSKAKLNLSPPLYLPNTAPIYFEPRTEEARVCYKTRQSNEILINSTTQQSLDIVNQFPIKFINYDNYDISQRYSILVNLYTQNLDSYLYYQKLKQSSSNENVLSPSQPGFIKGNISCTNKNNKVLGYFDVSTVSSKRIFFNYFDVFTDENTLPKYYDNCDFYEFEAYDFKGVKEDGDSKEGEILRIKINNKELVFYESYNVIVGIDDTMIFKMVKTICGECNTLGSNVKPVYWID